MYGRHQSCEQKCSRVFLITGEVMMENNRNNLWAVITGASSGIGYELAKQFATHGFDLLIVAEDPGIVEVSQILNSYGTKVDHVQIDLASFDGVEKLYNRIKAEKRPLDAIAINAGIGVGGASFDKTDFEKEMKLIHLNVMSTVHLTKRVLTDMLEVGHGRILFTSSVSAFMPGPYETVYSASKAFVQSFAEGIRAEVQDKGITITALQPGPTDTNFFHRAGMDQTKVGAQKKDDPADVAKVGFEALMSGKDSVISGIMNKIQANIAKVIPQVAAAKMHENLSKPNSSMNR
jgi:short-subunit dehydrogenase